VATALYMLCCGRVRLRSGAQAAPTLR
jgi:hypothetical protein